MNFGPRTLNTAGRNIQVTADGKPEWKSGGLTLDWSTVDAVGSDTTLDDETVVPSGGKYLPFGTVLALIGSSETQTIDLSGGDDPTGGTFTISYSGQTTDDIAYDASALTVQQAMEALSNIGEGGVSVAKSSFVYTLTFNVGSGNVAEVTVDSASLTSGGTVTVTVTTTGAGTGSGYYGPADTGASDGRQTLVRDACFILNETRVKQPGSGDTQAIGAIEAGRVYRARLQAGNAVSGASQPDIAAIRTAMPLLTLVDD